MAGQHTNLTTKWRGTKGYGGTHQRRHHHHDSSHRRSIWGVCLLLPLLVYGVLALLPRSGVQGGQRTAYTVGRNGSVDNSNSHGLGSMAAYRAHLAAVGSNRHISPIRSGVRVHDRPSGSGGVGKRAPAPAVTTPPEIAAVQVPVHLSSYNCTQLEQLWDYAGGNPGEAVTAASIAIAESGGNPAAYSPTDDVGLWQVNIASHGGTMASTDPVVNARSAIAISNDGANWTPWTTYTSGAYYGRC